MPAIETYAHHEKGHRTLPIVELSEVGKTFSGVRALAGVDLQIEPGRVHAIVGENGAGKSTLAKILMGVHQQDTGTVRVRGEDRHYQTPHDALQDGIAGIAQEVSLVRNRSVGENVFLGQELRTFGVLRPRRVHAAFEELEARIQFGIAPDVLAGSLSLADQQKVEIMRALARRADVIIMDEPTAAISRLESERLFEVIRSLSSSGTAVIYISHFLAEVLELADTITILRDGRLVRSAEAGGETPDTLIASMLGRPLEQVYPAKRPSTTHGEPRLEVSGLNRQGVFSDVSFSVQPGEIVGLAGLVGSGRTEIARAIFGADRADRGRVLLDGLDVTPKSPHAAIAAGIAYLTESRKDDGLLLGRSAAENVTLPHLWALSDFGVLRSSRLRQRADEQLERLSVTRKGARAPVRGLSGGNQQKVLFARWLLETPKVLIVDEPTRGVDIGAKAAIYALITGLAERGVAILMISSEHEELIGMATRVLVVRQGRIVEELASDEITEDAIVSAALTDRK
jgi:ABC-type sugar transport system ATPase subunit